MHVGIICSEAPPSLPLLIFSLVIPYSFTLVSFFLVIFFFFFLSELRLRLSLTCTDETFIFSFEANMYLFASAVPSLIRAGKDYVF